MDSALQQKILSIIASHEQISSLQIVYQLENIKERSIIIAVHMELADLVTKGHVSYFEVDEPRRVRRWYTITEAGKKALDEQAL